MQKIYVISFVFLIYIEFLQVGDANLYCARNSPSWAFGTESSSVAPEFRPLMFVAVPSKCSELVRFVKDPKCLISALDKLRIKKINN